MNIHVVFGLGVDLYRSYHEIYGSKGWLEERSNHISEDANPEALRKYRDAYTFYDAFEKSGHSYIAAYLTRTDTEKADAAFLEAMGAVTGLTDEERYTSFVKSFDIALYRYLLHDRSPFLDAELNDHPSLADPALRPKGFSKADDLMPYRFFIEIMTCREMKAFAIVLLVSGLVALALGSGGLLGVAAAATGLKAVGVTAGAATVGGTISAAVGAAILLYKPKPTERKLRQMGLVMHTLDVHVGEMDSNDGDPWSSGAAAKSSMSVLRDEDDWTFDEDGKSKEGRVYRMVGDY